MHEGIQGQAKLIPSLSSSLLNYSMREGGHFLLFICIEMYLFFTYVFVLFDHLRDLGILVNNPFSFVDHYKSMCSRAYMSLCRYHSQNAKLAIYGSQP